MAITTAAQAAAIMNESLTALGHSYQIDTTDGDTIEAGFKAIGAFPPSQLNALLEQANIILIYRNYGLMFDSSKNKTRVFWRDGITNGGGIEDIFHEIIEPVQGYWAADFAGKTEQEQAALAGTIAADLVAYHSSAVDKKFHTTLTHKTFPLSIAENEISKVFTASGFARYIDVKMANLQWSAEVHLQDAVIGIIAEMVLDKKVVFDTNNNLSTKIGVSKMVEKLNTYADDFKQPSTSFNYAGVKNMSDEEDIFLVTTAKYWNRLKTFGFANAFNLEEYKVKNRLLILPEGTEFGLGENGKPVEAILLDKRAIVFALRYWAQKPFVPSNTDYINYFLKIEYLGGYNEFFNAVAFECDGLDFFVDDSVEYVSVYTALTKQSVTTFEINGESIFDLDYNDAIVNPGNASPVAAKCFRVPKNSILKFKLATTDDVYVKHAYPSVYFDSETYTPATISTNYIKMPAAAESTVIIKDDVYITA